MPKYTTSHWGTYEVEQSEGGRSTLRPYRHDPDPSPIGLQQLDEKLLRMRVARPAVRKSYLEGGPGSHLHLRGREPFVEVDWDTATALAASALDSVRQAHGNEAIFGGSYGWSSAGRFHHAQSQIHRFLNTIGGYVRHVDSYSLGAARVVLPHVVDGMEELMEAHTSWDFLVRHTEVFVTFGGVPEKNAQVTAGGVVNHRVPGGLRAMADAGVRFVNVSPVSDNLKTGGDVQWIPIRPNTDTAFILAMAWVLETEGLVDRNFLDRCTVGYEPFRHYLLGTRDGVPKTPQWAQHITQVPADVITRLARDAASHRTMLNLAWSLQRQTHGEQPFWALIALAAMLGQIGTPGGGFGLGYGATNMMGSRRQEVRGPTFPQGRNAVEKFIPVARIADMLLKPGEAFTYNGQTHHYPDIRLVYWAGGNPFHHHQDLNRLRGAWERPETVIVNEQFWTPTAKYADIVFPTTTSLERDDIGFAFKEGHVVAMSQATAPFGMAKSDYDIFSLIAARLNVLQNFTEGRSADEWIRSMYEEFRGRAAAQDLSIPAFEDFWEAGIVDLSVHDEPLILLEKFAADPEGHPVPTPSGRIEITSATIQSFGLADCPGHPVWLAPKEWLGDPEAPPESLHLISDQPSRRLHSQLDSGPWSEAGKVQGREPVYINPRDAAHRGIRDGDIVELFNARGRCLAGAIVSAVVMPGVVRLSTGAWYDPEPGTLLERHGNPNALTLDVPASGLSQGCAAHTCLVQMRGPVVDAPQVQAFRPPVFAAAR